MDHLGEIGGKLAAPVPLRARLRVGVRWNVTLLLDLPVPAA
jgi:hypothetical protein